MNTENLISLKEFAERAGLRPDEVTRLITPQKIKVTKLGIHKFIDIVLYPPSDFKKQTKNKTL